MAPECHFIAGDKRLGLVEIGQTGGGFADQFAHELFPVCIELREFFDNVSQFIRRFIGKPIYTSDNQVGIGTRWIQDDGQPARNSLNRGSFHRDGIRRTDKSLTDGKA